MQETGRYLAQSRDAEIDLVELAQGLWRQRLLIIICVVVAALSAFGYSQSVTPVYSSQATIAPAAINSFGPLAGALNKQNISQESSTFASGVRLADEAFGILVGNLNSQIVRREFDSGQSDFSQISFQVSRGKQTADPVTLVATGTEPERASAFVSAYLGYATAITATQLSEYLKGMGVLEEVSESAIYRLEQPATLPSTPIKPKRTLIVALGFVLGGMLGVFIALIRMVMRRK